MKIYIVAELSPISRDLEFCTDVYKDPADAQRHVMDRLGIPPTVSWGEFLANDHTPDIWVDVDDEDDIIAFMGDERLLSYAVRTV